MKPEDTDFVSRATDLIKNHTKDHECRSCKFWNPKNVQLTMATCMNPLNDALVSVFNPHGFNYNDLRQALNSEKNSSCRHYTFEKDKYSYLQQAIDDIHKKYEDKK